MLHYLIKCIHPKTIVTSHFVSYTARDRATDLVAVKDDDVTCKGNIYKRVFFNACWTLEPIWAPLHYVTVVSNGSETDFFELTTSRSPSSPSGSQDSDADNQNWYDYFQSVGIKNQRYSDSEKVKGLEVTMMLNLPQKKFWSKLRFHLWQISTLGIHRGGMELIRERLSFRQKGCIIQEWVVACWKIIHGSFFKLFPIKLLFDCCMEAMSKQSSTKVANTFSEENFCDRLACGF